MNFVALSGQRMILLEKFRISHLSKAELLSAVCTYDDYALKKSERAHRKTGRRQTERQTERVHE